MDNTHFFLVGLTGGIAAGKSTVVQMFRQLGAAGVDADELARELTSSDAQLLAQMIKAFGEGILNEERKLDRSKLAELVFRDTPARRQLEALTHPAIVQAAQQRIEALRGAGHSLVFYEAALLVESGRYQMMDALIVVVADDAIRTQRLMTRSSLTQEEAERRLAAQLSQAEKVAHAHYVIDNSGTLEQTWTQVHNVWQQIIRHVQGK